MPKKNATEGFVSGLDVMQRVNREYYVLFGLLALFFDVSILKFGFKV